MRTTPPVAALLLAATAFGSETVIDVPQGSGVFPTVGQVDCLEEMGSGRFCAATYECADASGDLWGDLANHDGRRAIGVDSPVARERDCTITVDGKAAVRWFVGFSPDGRNGELVGLTAKHDAEPPVARRVAQGSGGSGSFLSWYVERHGIEDLIAEERDERCGHIKEGTPQLESCLRAIPHAGIVFAMAFENTPFTRCVAEMVFDLEAHYADVGERETVRPWELLAGSYYRCQSSPAPERRVDICSMTRSVAAHREGGPGLEGILPGRYAECRTLLEEQWEREGFGELQ